MSSMRGIDTPVRQRRRRVFKEVANLAYNSTNLKDDMEALPYKIVDYEESEFWESVYRDRAIIRERIRLAMGMSLRPENREHPGHLTQGLEESNIDEKYYEPPLMQVIPSACNACPENRYEVTSSCMGCLAHPCQSVCPKGAISMKNGKSVIDQEKCNACDWDANDKHSTEVLKQDTQSAVLKRTLDSTVYYVELKWEGKALLKEKEKNY